MEATGRRQFQIDTCLGRGGFGEVYRAVMRSPGGLRSEVAVKVLREGLDPAGQAIQRLRDEGRLLARLDHPTILRVHDLVLLDGRISLVTEFIDGQDLGEVTGPPDPIPTRALLEVIAPVAGALDSAWNAPLGDAGEPLRLVHRDIKPSNIRISRHGQVKLLDFGIARTDTVDREARTQTDLLVGSPAYMAPERFTANEVDPASDVFALGCVLYEGLTGRRLLGNVSLPMLSALALDEDRFHAHLDAHLPAVPSSVPNAVLELMVAMLEHDPRQRPTAAEVQHRSEELADVTAGRSLTRWCRERDWATPPIEEGVLDGRTITEGTLTLTDAIAPLRASDSLPPEPVGVDTARSVESLVVARPAPRGPRLGLALALVGVAVLLAGIVVVGGVAGHWAYTSYGVQGPVVTAAHDVPAPVVDPPDAAPGDADLGEHPASGELPATGETPAGAQDAPVDDPPPFEAASAGAAAPVTPSPGPAPTVVAPVAPAPVVSVAPARRAPHGQVNVSGTSAVRLVGEAGTFSVPASVPVGTYDIHASFEGGRLIHAGGTVVVEEGASVTVRCSDRMQRCDPVK